MYIRGEKYPVPSLLFPLVTVDDHLVIIINQK